MGEREPELMNLCDAEDLYVEKFGVSPDSWRLCHHLGGKDYHLRILRALDEGVPIDSEKEYGFMPYSKMPRDIVL